MSVYVGIDVHRKRSQVAIIDQDGKVLANRNVNNGVTPILSVIGGLPPGTKAAFEAAFGWGWLAGLLEDYGFEPHLVHPLQCKAIASARLKNDKVDAAIWRSCCARTCCRRRGSRRRRCASCGRCCGTGRSWCGCGRCCRTGSTRSWPTTATASGRLLERAGPGLARLAGPARRLGGGDLRCPGAHRRPAIGHRPARRRGPPARPVRPAGQGPDPAARRRPVHRAGPAGRDRRHHPVRLGAQAGVLGRAYPYRARQRPHGPARAYLQAGLGLGPLDLVRGRAEGQASPEFAASYQAIARRRGTKIATTAIARKLLTRAYHLLADAAMRSQPSLDAVPEA